MRFGLLYEHQLPRPWIEASEQELFEEAIEQVEPDISGRSWLTGAVKNPVRSHPIP
jgi:hypothetical protein